MTDFEQINKYLKEKELGYVRHLPLYPKEDTYLQICIYGMNLKIEKGFRCYKKAIESAMNKRIRELNKEAKLMRTVKRKVKEL